MKFSSKSALAATVIIFSVAAVIYNLGRFSKITHDLNAAQVELSEAQAQILRFNDMKKDTLLTIGYMNNILRGYSENFRAGIAMLYIYPGHNTEEFKIYNLADVPAYYRVLSQDVTEEKYSTRICGDIKVETNGFSNHEAVIKVTSGTKSGYNIIQFANRTNDEKFYVLVMVSR